MSVSPIMPSLDMHIFMTTSLLELEERSPAGNLRSGGTPDAVANWLISLAHAY